MISGGQTGVDRAALDAALEAGLAVGGFVPRGRLAEDGVIPERYPLQECDSDDFAVRNELNVRHSDATLILNRGELAGGTLLTAAFCRKHRKPCAVIALEEPGAEARVRAFIDQEAPRVLNVAGPRESKAPGIYVQALRVLRRALGPA